MTPYFRHIEDDSVHTDIRDVLQSGNLILFAGAGLSAQAVTEKGEHPPLWRGLIEGVLAWCQKKQLIDGAGIAEMMDLVKDNYLIDAGQELQEILEEPSWLQECLSEVVLYNLAKTGEAQQLIAQIPFRAYLTTNYDEFIEGEYRVQKGVTLPKFYERTIEGVLGAFRAGKPFILKMHGDISDPSSIVLGNRSYERLFQPGSHYQRCIETIFGIASVLFVGFGGSDPDLDGITSRVAAFDGRSRRHWMVVARDACPPLRAKRLWKDKGINVVYYDRDSTHSGLVRFLRMIAQPVPLTIGAATDRSEVQNVVRKRLEAVGDA